jgi:vesicle-fusing ATPase
MATTSQRNVMEQLDVADAFDHQIPVPAVRDVRELATVLTETGAFGSPGNINEVVNMVRQFSSDHVGVGIKTILSLTEAAQFANGDPGQWFVEQLGRQIARHNPNLSIGPDH